MTAVEEFAEICRAQAWVELPRQGMLTFIGPPAPEHLLPKRCPWREVVATGEALFVRVVDAGIAESRNAARRLIEGGGIRVDDVRITDPFFVATLPALLRKGTHGEPVRVVQMTS